MLDIKPNIYNCCDFSKVDSIGVLCRGKSLGSIGKYKENFRNIFVAGQHYNSFNLIGEHIKNSNIIRISGNVYFRLTEEYKDLYETYNIKDMQTTLSPTLSARKDLKFKKMQNQHYNVLDVYPCPLNMTERNSRFILKRKHADGRLGYPTIGLFSVDLACLYKPKSVHIIGLDFYYANVFVKEQDNRSWRKNIGKTSGMVEYFQLLCQEESDIQFYLYTCCEKIKSQGNLKVIRV